MASDESDVDLVADDDYYAWLGLGRNATVEEIEKAYREMSRRVHPDKHATDPDKKQKAEEWFTKIKKAHEGARFSSAVLRDPHKKAIYDTLGVKGLETEGWEVIAREKTPQEIIEEYERLQKEREERRLNERTNPEGSISVTVNATDLFDRYEALDSIEYRDSLPSIEISDMSISQSVSCPLTTKDTAVLSGTLSSSKGSGDGYIAATCRRLISHNGWAEVEVGAGNGMRFSMRGFRTLWKRGYGTMSGTMQVTPSGLLKPGLTTTVATQLDEHTQGRLTWNWGFNSSMRSVVIWDKASNHVSFIVQLGMPVSFVMCSYTRKFIEQDAKVKGLVRFGTFGAVLEYGCDKKITKFSRLGASLSIGVPSGVILRIRLNRGNQTYQFPVHLSEGIVPEAIFYGTVVPFLVYGAIRVLIVNPYVKSKEDRELREKKEANKKKQEKKIEEAVHFLHLHRESIEKSFRTEEGIGGLVITRALFGKLEGNDAQSQEYIEIKDQLQSNVVKSELLIQENTTWSEMAGFYDPCVGEAKQIMIEYNFRREPHKAIFSEGQKIKLPNRGHKI